MTLTDFSQSGISQESLGYAYDLSGNMTSYDHAIAGGQSWHTAYAFDRADRLIGETRTGGTSMNFANVYNLDKAGNRTSVVRNGVSNVYAAAGDNDQFVSGDGYSVSLYDGNRNPVSMTTPSGSFAFVYDQEDQATSLTTPTETDTFRYDGDGHRVEKVDSSGTKRFVYDGDTIIADTDGANAIQFYYLPGVGHVIASTGGQRFYRSNALGSQITQLNNVGGMNNRTEYDAFGVEYSVTGGTKTAFRFAGSHGYYHDDASGLELLGHRYYIPTLGRFLTQDPKGQSAGSNLYEYCGNNPLVALDPSGLQGVDLSSAFRHFLGDPESFFTLQWSSTVRAATLHYNGWGNAMSTTSEFALGVGPGELDYGPFSIETLEMRVSSIGTNIDASLASHGWLAETEYAKGSISTTDAFLNTIAEPWNGTQAQVGAIKWEAWRKGSSITVKVLNDISFNSFAYHLPGVLGLSNWDSGPMHTVRQRFIWSESAKG